jgi:hypothetical protein
MRIREAKDFLVTQAEEQAVLEGAPLSGLEKRMMYFTESDGAIEDPFRLNEDFEGQYDSEEYESRISKLLHHAHARVKKENIKTARLWSEAIRALSKGDHYLLVLWNQESFTDRPPYDSLKLLGAGILVAAAMLGWQIWVAPRISGIEGLSSALHTLWMLLQTSRIVFVFTAATLILVALLGGISWLLHNRGGSRTGQDS